LGLSIIACSRAVADSLADLSGERGATEGRRETTIVSPYVLRYRARVTRVHPSHSSRRPHRTTHDQR
jgi:hypothetical protein